MITHLRCAAPGVTPPPNPVSVRSPRRRLATVAAVTGTALVVVPPAEECTSMICPARTRRQYRGPRVVGAVICNGRSGRS